MIEQAKQLFVVEYSISQDAIRIRSVGAMLKKNLQDLAKNSITDYVPVALLATRAQAEVYEVEFQHHLEVQVLSGSRNWTHISEAMEKFLSQRFGDTDSNPSKTPGTT